MLRRCTSCTRYTLQDQCPACGDATKDPRPPKFSPEDKYGAYRRKLKRLDEEETRTPAEEGA
jgi:H/ACA ribonucleoprotein complex subunit 3